MDLLATFWNNKLPTFVLLVPDLVARTLDALSLSLSLSFLGRGSVNILSSDSVTIQDSGKIEGCQG